LLLGTLMYARYPYLRFNCSLARQQALAVPVVGGAVLYFAVGCAAAAVALVSLVCGRGGGAPSRPHPALALNGGARRNAAASAQAPATSPADSRVVRRRARQVKISK